MYYVSDSEPSDSIIADFPIKTFSSFMEVVLGAPASNENRGKKVFIGRGMPFNDQVLSDRLVHQGFVEKPELIRCYEIVAIPHHREEGLFLISKEEVLGIRDNRELMSLLAQPDDPKIASMTDDEVIDYLPVSANRRLYCFGLSSSDISFAGLLDCEEVMRKSQLHPATNPDVGIMEGINTSQFYYGGVNSFSEIHVEDSLTPAINVGILLLHPIFVLHRVQPVGYSKIWMVFPERNPLEKAIHDIQAQDVALALQNSDFLPEEDASMSDEEITSVKVFSRCVADETSKTRDMNGKKIRKTSEVTVQEVFMFSGSCSSKLSHKNLYINTKFAHRYGIEYETLRQGPHDVVYTAEGVPHQVGQLSANVAEASNFAGPEFNVYARLVPYDPCPESKLSSFPPNRHQITTVKTRKRIIYECRELMGCKFTTTNKEVLRVHCNEVHGAKVPKVQNRITKKCTVCGAEVKRLAHHIRTSQSHAAALSLLTETEKAALSDPRPVWRCQFCGVEYLDEENLQDHERICEFNLPSSSIPRYLTKCNFCGRNYHSSEILQHERTCETKKYKCSMCRRTYKKSYSLQCHYARCHP
ncbi:hypothetical protein QAD02_001619 [Eretmocerus hayati]|uniref:Uncharacterized protein n=1 Tax=Eretmocerus hayati TaxID=131215 RepID=A0ACC2NGM3_9HYME|nr:hypothetical protein QAD02_001619 [Eretmocerus hayati]